MFTERVYFCDCVSAKLYPAHCESGALQSARVLNNVDKVDDVDLVDNFDKHRLATFTSICL